MIQCTIKISPQALQDIEDTHDYIAYELFEPVTADKYIRAIYETIEHLSIYGGSIAVSMYDSLITLYGPSVRSVVYKKMTIIYTLNNTTIVIRQIKPGSLIL